MVIMETKLESKEIKFVKFSTKNCVEINDYSPEM